MLMPAAAMPAAAPRMPGNVQSKQSAATALKVWVKGQHMKATTVYRAAKVCTRGNC